MFRKYFLLLFLLTSAWQGMAQPTAPSRTEPRPSLDDSPHNHHLSKDSPQRLLMPLGFLNFSAEFRKTALFSGDFKQHMDDEDSKEILTDDEDAPKMDFINHLISSRHKVTQVEKSPIRGLYQIVIGSDVYYLSHDGRYIIQGDVIDLQTQENLTDTQRNQLRRQWLDRIPTDDLIVFPAHGYKQYAVTVFSDADCAYCRVIHENLEHYNALGIEVRFAAFPRMGLNSPSFQKIMSIWCAEDRHAALIGQLSNVSIGRNQQSNMQCDMSSVKREYAIALQMGVNGTPSFVLQDGTLIAGYVSPDNLLRILQRRSIE